jgi:hypothetical protein
MRMDEEDDEDDYDDDHEQDQEQEHEQENEEEEVSLLGIMAPGRGETNLVG